MTIADLIEYRLAQEMLVHPRRRDDGAARGRAASPASSAPASTRPTSRRPSTWRWCWATSSPTSRCWCACRPPDMLRDVFGVGAADDDHPATVSLRMIEDAGTGILLYVLLARRGPACSDGLGRRADRRRRVQAAAARLRPRRAGAGAPRRAHDPPADQPPAAASSASAATAWRSSSACRSGRRGAWSRCARRAAEGDRHEQT